MLAYLPPTIAATSVYTMLLTEPVLDSTQTMSMERACLYHRRKTMPASTMTAQRKSTSNHCQLALRGSCLPSLNGPRGPRGHRELHVVCLGRLVRRFWRRDDHLRRQHRQARMDRSYIHRRAPSHRFGKRLKEGVMTHNRRPPLTITGKL